MTDITYHLANIERRVASALERAGRSNDEVKIVAVSKQQPASRIAEARAAGQRDFGENYIQEALSKMDELAHLDIVWHFIGALQSNKTRSAAERFDWVHTVDRSRLARRLNAQRPAHADPLNVLIQLNLDREPQKAGVTEDEIEPLAREIVEMPRLKLRGLMTIPPAAITESETRRHFSAVAGLLRRLNEAGFELDTLSMGMSGDFEAAIECGSTCVRIGTAIFGPRHTGRR